MAEVEYKREMNRNYMVIHPEPGGGDKYTIRMLSGNQVPGLLLFHEKWINGDNWYYYDITSRQPLGRILDCRNLKVSELKIFLESLIFAFRQIERFLLDESQICLEPDLIYTEPETFRCALTLIPGQYGDFTKAFRNLSQYLLDHVNQNDGEAVVMAFSVFKECQKENFGIDDIEKCLGKDLKPEPVSVKERIQIREEESVDFMPPEETEPEPIPNKEGQDLFAVGMLILLIIVPLGVFLRSGVNGIFRWKWYLAGAELLIAVMFAVYCTRKKNVEVHEENMDIEVHRESWEEYLRNSENFEFDDRGTDREDMQEEMQTELLTVHSGSLQCRTLVSIDGNLEIPIPYFPFLIGKNESLADYCLNEPGVSRLHVKLEEDTGHYYVTDLNSTNGTRVDGRLLNANETCELIVGSELSIAAGRFFFR